MPLKDLMERSLLEDDGAGAPAHSPASEKPRVYLTRWWVLFQYSLFTTLQGWTWAIPGSLSDTYIDLFGLDEWTIQIFLNYGAVLFLVVAFPVGYAMDKKGGIRTQLIIGSLLVTTGAVLRIFARNPGNFSLGCLHVSYILTALAGPVAMSAVSKLSEEWFPVHERTTATAIATICNGLGSAFSSLVGPGMVQDGTQASLQSYNYLMLALTGVNLLCIIAYYPPAPPTPPSISASVSQAAGERLTWGALRGVLWRIASNRNVMVLAAVYGIGGGMQAGWNGVANMNLNTIGVSQYAAGMIGFTCACVGNLAGVGVGMFADRFRTFKPICVGGSVLGGLATIWIVAALEGWLPPSWMQQCVLQPQLYVAFVLSYGSICIYPLLFELAIEATHPLPEASVITVLTFVYNAGAAVMLLVPLQSAGAAFNYTYGGVQVALVVLLVACFQENFGRFEVDTGAATASGEGAEGGKVLHDEEDGQQHGLGSGAQPSPSSLDDR